MKTNDSTQKECFIITPIGNASSEIRRKADGVINSVLKPILEEMNIKPIVPHESDIPGPIDDTIIKYILNCHLCIANLTGLNPNVMYELAVRHAANKPIVCIIEDGTQLPFDITTERVLFYTNDMQGVIELRNKLPNFIKNALNTTQLNPITHANSEFKIDIVKTSFEQTILDKMENLTSYIQYFSSNKYSSIPKNTYRKIRPDNSTTYYICTEQEANMYDLKERGYSKIVSDNKHLDGSK